MVLYKHCFLYLFWSKFDFRKLPTVLAVSSLTGLTFLSQKSTYSRNSNHRWKIREQKENFQTILAKMFWNFTVFQYRFYSPQVKQNLISTLTNLVCELSRKRLKTFLALLILLDLSKLLQLTRPRPWAPQKHVTTVFHEHNANITPQHQAPPPI